MFEMIQMAPPDAILGLTEAFRKDANPQKINLSVGVYQDGSGSTPIFASVKEAESRVLREETTKTYRPINGDVEYRSAAQQLLFGADHEIFIKQRATTVHTPGGTGALRVAADYLKKMHGDTTVWFSEPTWANHLPIFQSAGLQTKTYSYFDRETNGLAFDQMIAGLMQVPAGDVVLLHGCCHNPTGVDPDSEQWQTIAAVLSDRGALPLIDFAYQGLASGLREDTTGLLAMCRPDHELLICNSFSKNFGLYNERVGGLTIVTRSQETAARVLSQVKRCIRTNYSNPPAHGATIVTVVLNDLDLRRQWEGEIKQMRNRIASMRRLFVETLEAKGAKVDMSFVTRQHGMFSYTGLTKDRVQTLREKHSIYIVDDGRMNVAGMTEANMAYLCDAIAAVL